MVVVKPRAIRQDSVGTDLDRASMLTSNIKFGVVGVNGEVFKFKSSKIISRVLKAIVPANKKTLVGEALNEGLGILDLLVCAFSFN